MNRASLPAALLGLTLLLTACPQTTTPPPDPVEGCTATNAGAPTSLAASASVNAGTALSVVYQAPFDGSWDLSNLPDWLSASPLSGCGTIKTTLSVNRSAAAPHAADQPRLSADVTLSWTANPQRSQTSGDTTLKVSADLYTLTGQVSGVVAAAPPVLPAAALRVNGAPTSRGVIVKYKTAAAFSSAVSALSNSPLTAQGLALSAPAGRTLTLRTQNVAATIEALKADPNVEYAVPDAVLRAQAADMQAPYVPADQYAPLQYAYRLMGYGAVWRDMKNAPYPNQVTVAVIDTGVRFDHPDLAGRLWKSGEGALDIVTSDAYGPDTDPTDPGEAGGDGSHGTHVTGIIVAGEGNFTAPCSGCSTSGVVGAALTAPLKVLPVRVIDHFGNASESDVAQAIRYAAGETITVKTVNYTNPHPAKIINLSLGGPISADAAQPLCDAVKAASDKGALVVVAAGNGGAGQPYYPAACSGAVSVGSVRPDEGGLPRPAEYSEHYAQVALAAYGGSDPSSPTYHFNLQLNGKSVPDSVFSTSWDYQKNQPSYQFESGTSQAAPQVSALAALLLSKGVVSTAAQALQKMEDTATDLGTQGRDEYSGYGVINAAAALGAPAVSNTFTLSILGDHATFAPLLGAAGRFTAYLPDGNFQVLAGYDRSGNGLGGEVSEPRAKANVTLGPSKPAADLGTLNVSP
ncbi:S8 family serine peptidase [Deinococcus irradiatisoli]|nr:S8 family serine peptidase [Deinococcus irradiatisoli]